MYAVDLLKTLRKFFDLRLGWQSLINTWWSDRRHLGLEEKQFPQGIAPKFLGG